MKGLKNCPFCGKEAVVKPDDGLFGNLFWLVGCDTKDCYGNMLSGPMYHSKRDAVKAWNMRNDEIRD